MREKQKIMKIVAMFILGFIFGIVVCESIEAYRIYKQDFSLIYHSEVNKAWSEGFCYGYKAGQQRGE